MQTAPTIQCSRRRPLVSAITTPIAVTAEAIAWPDGYDAADVSINVPGGRGRFSSALTGPIASSLSTTAVLQAVSASQRRRTAMTSVTTARTGHSTAVPKTTLSTSATGTSGGQRSDTISS